MSDQVKVTWVQAVPNSKRISPDISFYGLLVPYIYLPGIDMTWSDPDKTSPLALFLEELLVEEKPERISTAQLYRATGVPRDFWALALRNLERAGRVVANEEEQHELDQVYKPVLLPGHEGETVTIRRRVRVNRDLVVFPESDELLIAPEDGSDRLNAFIHTFAGSEGDWFRTALLPDVKRRSLKTYLGDIASASRTIGGEENAAEIVFGVNGPRPAFVSVKAIAGLIDVKGDKVMPWFTHVQRRDQDGVRAYSSHERFYESPHLPMTSFGSLAAKIEDRLNSCQQNEVLDAAKLTAPVDVREYQTLRLQTPFSFSIESEVPARHSLDVEFSDIRFRILIKAVTSF
ncbi:hypothetical protein [Neorhizobium tomejilense]|uniref:hypothetical protein n=1 Tax=Neorhizobium tomejilense TaxID=2093828 RepID=UPI000CF99944|nr:hypothetical protein [Neorhizobium tomejilense]